MQMHNWSVIEELRINAVSIILKAFAKLPPKSVIVRGSVALVCYAENPRCPNDVDVYTFITTNELLEAFDREERIVVTAIRQLKSSSASLSKDAVRIELNILNDVGQIQDRLICDATPPQHEVTEYLSANVGMLGSKYNFSFEVMSSIGMVAEKLVGYLDSASRAHSIRWQDLYDIAVLANSVSFNFDQTVIEVRKMASIRQLSLQADLPLPPMWWNGPWAKYSWPDHKWEDLSTTFKAISEFANPLLNNSEIEKNVRWDPNKWNWMNI